MDRMDDVKNILLAGVGGQGTILVSKILSDGLIDAGYDVKMSEVHGMSQRGGSVTTQVVMAKTFILRLSAKGRQTFLSLLRRWKPCGGWYF